MNKPIFESLTMIGGALYGAIQLLETQGVLMSGTSTSIAEVVTGLVALYGLRRAIQPKA